MRHVTNFGLFIVFAAIAGVVFEGCYHRYEESQIIQSRMDSLERKIYSAYTPGYGELMLNIQLHHAKLWFAGSNNNWQLASYNESLIRSAFRKIRLYHPTDPNTAASAMIDGPLDSISRAISLKRPVAFRHSFDILTATCNNCHAVTQHAFNVITIPHGDPFGNQDFSLHPNAH